eukprot:CAMPEP_0201711708 /NCGR_PEP_ID=MMETSP0578-20130828/59279_1 /ASSEMBLY_ACC=CAM_ASM_000663 /TAXON_ID=267565 /ORGANISM="Skeletonema grethea, Strain CCMP 1804" /LENGTH=219 /DNA_ID=CAMNT_0048200765 /DNA_START=555 /DNA_END=1214 /DNA_ORIENTATION=-
MGTDSEAKAKSELAENNSILTRKIIFYAFLATLIADTYASKAEVLNHLTLWSLILHMLYFELHLPSKSTTTLIRLYHGPSICGSFALFNMYLWTLIANPSMEFDLAPEGRATWLIYARGFWTHLGPILCHAFDIQQNGAVLREAYASAGWNTSKLYQFWMCLGGYFAMGLTWEQVNGDASGTYNVTMVSPEMYVLISKAIGVVSCIVAFVVVVKPKLLD